MATYRKKSRRGPGRPPGSPNKITAALHGRLDDTTALVSRDLLREVIAGANENSEVARKHPADYRVAALLWMCALRARNDPRYLNAALRVEERLWGRVKQELEHSVPGGDGVRLIIEHIERANNPDQGAGAALGPEAAP
jgi:hypothetical protein